MMKNNIINYYEKKHYDFAEIICPVCNEPITKEYFKNNDIGFYNSKPCHFICPIHEKQIEEIIKEMKIEELGKAYLKKEALKEKFV